MAMNDDHGTDEMRNRLYALALRRVMWDEKKEEILRQLEVNGLPPDEAEGLYAEAVAERVRTIRGGYWKKVWQGAALMTAGAATYGGLWFWTEGFTVYGVRSATIPGLLLAYGMWKATSGLAGVAMAASKRGPVADID